MSDKMIATYVCTRNLYFALPAAYMSFITNNPNSEVYCFIEDDTLPYEVPENVHLVNASGQTLFTEENCVNMDTGFKPMTMIRAAWPVLFTGEPNGYGIETLPYADKVFQFDVDTYVLENLTPVWQLDMNDHWFAATQEYLSVHKPKPVYWNLGFGLIGLEAIRKDGLADYMVQDLRWVKYPWIDQDCLCRLGFYNRDKVWDLGVRYNCCSQTGHVNNPAISHMCAVPGYKFIREDVPDFEKIKKWREYYRISECLAAGYVCDGVK